MPRNIDELDDLANKLRVDYRKAFNYGACVARDYFEAKSRIESGEYGSRTAPNGRVVPWDMNSWMIDKVRLFDSQIVKFILLFQRVLADGDRAALQAQQQRVKQERRETRDAAAQAARAVREAAARERDAVRQQKAAEKAVEEAEKAAKAAEKQHKDAAEKAAKKKAAQKAARDPDRNERGRRKVIENKGITMLKEMLASERLPLSTCERIARMPAEAQPQGIDEALANPRVRSFPARHRPSADEKVAGVTAALNAERSRATSQTASTAPAEPADQRLASLLAECRQIESTSRIELGKRYAAMKEIVQTQQAGLDPSGKHWTWGAWAKAYIQRSRQDINRCIAEFGTSCSKTQDDNVIILRKNIN